MAEDGPRVINEMQQQIVKTKESIATFAEQVQDEASFADRDEGNAQSLRIEFGIPV